MAYPEVKLKLPKVTQYVLHTLISIQYAATFQTTNVKACICVVCFQN